jgi:hypothetical protein
MKTETELEKDILNITSKIQMEYPELSKYIKEIPVNISKKDKDDINNGNMEEYYNSLVELLAEYSKTHKPIKVPNAKETLNYPGYPHYPPSEDIYNKGKKEMKLNPEDSSKNKSTNENEGSSNEKTFKEDMSADDLDVPGTELDDQQERVGSEDEENNYYSLGGDNHNDLEENKG